MPSVEISYESTEEVRQVVDNCFSSCRFEDGNQDRGSHNENPSVRALEELEILN